IAEPEIELLYLPVVGCRKRWYEWLRPRYMGVQYNRMNGENSSVFRRSSTLRELLATRSRVHDSKRITNRRYRPIVLSSTALVLVVLLGLEIKSSWLESRVLAAIAGKLSFSLEQGASHAIQYSSAGPYDERLGYSRLPNFLAQLESSGFRLESQARESKMYLLLAKLHIYPVY